MYRGEGKFQNPFKYPASYPPSPRLETIAKNEVGRAKQEMEYWQEKLTSWSFFWPFDRGFVLQAVGITVVVVALNVGLGLFVLFNGLESIRSGSGDDNASVEALADRDKWQLQHVLASSIFLLQPWLFVVCWMLLPRLELWQKGYTKRRIPGFPSPAGDDANYRGTICAKRCATFADFTWFDPSPLLDKPAGARRIAVATTTHVGGGGEDGLVHVPILTPEHFARLAPPLPVSAAGRVSFVLPL